jgi:glucokinase
MKEIAVGIDIGGTNTIIGMVDRDGKCIHEKSFRTGEFKGFEEYLKKLAESITEMSTEIGKDYKIQGIGIGAPNGNFYEGTIEEAPNLPWKGKVHFVDEFRKLLDYPMVLTNDANAAAIGEMIYGAAKGMKNFIMITLGTGLGSGFVVNGELIYGGTGFAGELGHIIVNPQGRHCGCGRIGCLETYVSATGIKRTVYKMLADYMFESELKDIPFNELNGKMITDAAQRNDQVALAAFEHTGKMLGEKLADAVAIMSPEAIFMFGGLSLAGDLIFKPTIEHMEKNLLEVFKGTVKVLPSGLQNVNIAVYGASALIWKLFEN